MLGWVKSRFWEEENEVMDMDVEYATQTCMQILLEWCGCVGVVRVL
jgi:hypothetical protein